MYHAGILRQRGNADGSARRRRDLLFGGTAGWAPAICLHCAPHESTCLPPAPKQRKGLKVSQETPRPARTPLPFATLPDSSTTHRIPRPHEKHPHPLSAAPVRIARPRESEEEEGHAARSPREWAMSAAPRVRPSLCETRRDVRHSDPEGCDPWVLRWMYKLTAGPSAVSVAGLSVTNSRGQTLLKVTPNSYPAQGYRAQKEPGEESPVEYIQVGAVNCARGGSATLTGQPGPGKPLRWPTIIPSPTQQQRRTQLQLHHCHSTEQPAERHVAGRRERRCYHLRPDIHIRLEPERARESDCAGIPLRSQFAQEPERRARGRL